MEAAVQQPLHSCLIGVDAGAFLCLRYDLHSTRIRTRRIFESPVPRLAALRLLMGWGSCFAGLMWIVTCMQIEKIYSEQWTSLENLLYLKSSIIKSEESCPQKADGFLAIDRAIREKK